jgi:hypothetical protein
MSGTPDSSARARAQAIAALVLSPPDAALEERAKPAGMSRRVTLPEMAFPDVPCRGKDAAGMLTSCSPVWPETVAARPGWGS